MRILTISDTHNKHKQIPSAYIDNVDGNFDMIIHAGDFTVGGFQLEAIEFLEWFSKLPFEHKILIAGNHDFYFDEAPEYAIEALLAQYPQITYLNDSGCEINGFKIWGSPITLYFHNYAFNKLPWDINEHWDMIPDNTDILVTHGPIWSYLDLIDEGYNKGCDRLLEHLPRLKDLKLVVHGHIHEGYGTAVTPEGVMIVNASVLNRHNIMWNAPIGVEITKKDGSED